MKCQNCGCQLSSSTNCCHQCGKDINKTAPGVSSYLVTILLIVFNLLVITGGLEYHASIDPSHNEQILIWLHSLFAQVSGATLFGIWLVVNFILMLSAWKLSR
jgi:uncharacterized protein (DUF983 family)